MFDRIMELKTKYDIGDVVYTVSGNRIKCGIITNIEAYARQDDIVKDMDGSVIDRRITTDVMYRLEGVDVWVEEMDLTPTKDELIARLLAE